MSNYNINNKQKEKLKRLFLHGAPRYMRIYDNGGASLDRYTIVFTGRYKKAKDGVSKEARAHQNRRFDYVSASQTGAGVYLHDSTNNMPCDRPGYRHLGKKINFGELDEALQNRLIRDYLDVWGYEDNFASCIVNKNTKQLTGVEFAHYAANDFSNTHLVYSLFDKKYYHKEKSSQIFFSENTETKIISIIVDCYHTRTRIILDYGDKATGQSWGEENDIIGYIGRTTGDMKAPILVYNVRSNGGGIILTECIVKIETSKGKDNLYTHPNYSPAK